MTCIQHHAHNLCVCSEINLTKHRAEIIHPQKLDIQTTGDKLLKSFHCNKFAVIYSVLLKLNY